MIKPKYLACIWCGGDLKSLEAMYCSKICMLQAQGRAPVDSKIKYGGKNAGGGKTDQVTI